MCSHDDKKLPSPPVIHSYVQLFDLIVYNEGLYSTVIGQNQIDMRYFNRAKELQRIRIG